jgi:pimeloyl-ACP methyl ester carboxylesterase
MEVPENRDDPSSATVRIAVTVVKSRSATPETDPVVQITGGPGGSGLSQLGFWSTSPLLDHRDMVLFDQRGAGASEPSLDCPERDAALATNLGRAEPYEVEVETYRDALAACRVRLLEAGADLDQYDTESVAADLADLRVALGVDEWNLYGISYGSRIALATMRSHPEGIRSVVLDSAYPPGVGSLADLHARGDAAFDAFYDACAADAACAASYPDLESTLEAVVDRYNETPITARPISAPPPGSAPS